MAAAVDGDAVDTAAVAAGKQATESLASQVSSDSGAPMANTEDDEDVTSSESDLDSEDDEEKNKDKEEKVLFLKICYSKLAV